MHHLELKKVRLQTGKKQQQLLVDNYDSTTK